MIGEGMSLLRLRCRRRGWPKQSKNDLTRRRCWRRHAVLRLLIIGVVDLKPHSTRRISASSPYVVHRIGLNALHGGARCAKRLIVLRFA
jgi:hypothetical protein